MLQLVGKAIPVLAILYQGQTEYLNVSHRNGTDHAVVIGSPLLSVLDERLANVSEHRQTVETTDLIPRLSRQPGGRVAVSIVKCHSTGQQETPLSLVDSLIILQQVDAEDEREQKLQNHARRTFQ